MRHFSFNIKDFRSIERVCGAATGKYKGHPSTEFIHYVCKDGICNAYGGNGFGIGKVTVPYTTSDNKETDSEEYVFLMDPIKGPYGTDRVDIDTYSDKDHHTAHMVNLKDSSKSVDMTAQAGLDEPENYEQFFTNYNEALSAKEIQGFATSLKINPRMLYDMLKGYMHCDSVLLQFTSPSRPLKIKAFPQEMDAESFIQPMRLR